MDATSSAVRPTSPQTSPRPKPKIRRPSVSSPMTWLSRASSSSSASNAPYAPSRPVRISEPRFADPTEALTHQRSGVLGAGAIVVRTPQDALAGPRASASSPDLLTSSRSPSPRRLMSMEYEDRHDIERPGSPPLPPIPDSVSEYEEEEYEVDASAETATLDDWQSTSVMSHPPPPSRPPPSIPSIPDYDSEVAQARPISPLRPTAKAMAPPADYFSSAPAGPGGVPVSPPQSPFDAILVSPVPSNTLEPSKIIVSLETSTATQRTTMATLVSRPSCLASFLLGLFPSTDSDSRSVYSTNSEVESSFNSIFHHHLASSGVLTHASSNLHIFLDRPSAPLPPVTSLDARVPRRPSACRARLNGSSARLEALLELRDEACYLGLDELERLCTEELRHRQGTPSSLGLGLHMRGFSNASNHSVRSLHTLRERAEPAEGAVDRAALRKSDDSGFASGETGGRKSGSSAELDAPWPSPPATIPRPAYMKDRSPKRDGYASLKTKPTGEWI
ncbi:uncharacterized protein TRAVEDRAFT_44789 [Trametes versicolor FP-101664 SS1]|uniref:uncharacterized protein n=1 Tax=Trametes versicolor (strain FP-101664) TaxID=717944 RepID=UPI0004622CDF|nr:uncharacterized protein TRAVEDRAFT_44789 [Trametes versicolor FP-101664 SS1]EIW61960.1 hypothetical protein TRAVEDRAFT_44789 [Trametes versicolor FP-101664 SS1]